MSKLTFWFAMACIAFYAAVQVLLIMRANGVFSFTRGFI